MVPGSPNDSSQGWIAGLELSPQELHYKYGLPQQEITSFHQFIYLYPEGSAIIREGEKDKTLFLLRVGRVEVYKQAGTVQELVGNIDAINFFGEMSLINDEPRSATVIAKEGTVVVYKFTQPNIPLILQNPKWAELLISRLSKDLAHSNQQLVQHKQQIQDLRQSLAIKDKEIEAIIEKQEEITQKTRRAFGSILYFQGVVRQLAIVGSKGWAFLNALMDMSQVLIKHYLPDMVVSEDLAEEDVIRNCLALVRRGDQEKLFNELEQTLKFHR